jgi:hypothetical protein
MRSEARRKGLLPSTFHCDCILKPAMVLDKREHGVFAIAETTSTDLVKSVVSKGMRQGSLVPHPKMRRFVEYFPGKSGKTAFPGFAAKVRRTEEEFISVWLTAIQARDVFAC